MHCEIENWKFLSSTNQQSINFTKDENCFPNLSTKPSRLKLKPLLFKVHTDESQSVMIMLSLEFSKNTKNDQELFSVCYQSCDQCQRCHQRGLDWWLVKIFFKNLYLLNFWRTLADYESESCPRYITTSERPIMCLGIRGEFFAFLIVDYIVI